MSYILIYSVRDYKIRELDIIVILSDSVSGSLTTFNSVPCSTTIAFNDLSKFIFQAKFPECLKEVKKFSRIQNTVGFD